MKILVDVGGSSVKIKKEKDGKLSSYMRSFKPTSRLEFYSCILEVARKSSIDGIAVSVCGEYDYVTDEVLTCWHYPFLKGKLRSDLEKEFKCWNVHVVNDGDAHALALKVAYAKKGLLCTAGAVNLSLGTAVGFGVLDCKGDLMHTCQGHNWEIGNWQCDTMESTKDLYSALGSAGLRSIEERHGNANAYRYYGQRLCHFIGRDLVPLFHPKIIGLSGGIVAGHCQEIEEGIRLECEKCRYREPGKALDGVDIYFSPERDSVMLGLSELLNRNTMRNVLKRLSMFFGTRKSTDADGGLSTCDIQDAGVVPGFILQCQYNEDWSRCASDDELIAEVRGEHGEISEERLEELIVENGSFSRAPHAWRELCWRHGEPLTRRLLFEKPLRDSSGWERNVPENCPCAIVGFHSGKVVCAEDAGNGQLVANRLTCLGSWEIFTPIKNDDGSFALKSHANGKFVSADPNKDGVLVAQGRKVDSWEKFDIKELSGKPGIFTLWSRTTQKFVSVDEVNGNVLMANRDDAASWEEFRIFTNLPV